ncbi:IS3 family transposase [Falsigemmobacter intermedius]|uniref:IS3 family transposase n=1 Tax=Falsigemmobacter intermedius TaxID=1553448 RepID=A0A3S3Y5K1_9RHOB|nr:IS3 family transposase [Falsigemmobacter intermedius]RWY37675.1 IS3 family transposase [Falsigemmobacter intermedius]
MYSYEERMRAVALYIKLGKRPHATIRELGYPSRNALKAWYREYEQQQDLPARSAPRQPKFSEAQKQAALAHYASHGRCVSGTMRALGYPGRAKLTAWVREAFPEVRSVSSRARGPGEHSEEVKKAAVVGLYCRSESAAALAKKVGVSRETLYAWKNQLLGAEAPATMKRKTKLPLDPEIADLERQREALQRSIHELRIEHDLLKTASDLIKKDLGGDLQDLSNREKTQLIVALRSKHKRPELLTRLKLARSSYFYHRTRISLEDKYLPVRQAMKDAFESNHSCYGYRRLKALMERRSVTISEKVVRRLMKQEALVVPRPRRRRYSSYLGEISPAPENLLNRDFQADAPNEKWLTDITEFRIRAGKVYLSPIIDCFDGMVISWAIGTRPDADLANTMLDAALETIEERRARPIIHSDRGGHYRWQGWLDPVNAAGLVRSMSRKASSQDNAPCEGFFGRLKTEFFYPRDWQAFSVEQFIDAVDGYIRWYNETRIKMSLGGRSPIEYRESLGLAI